MRYQKNIEDTIEKFIKKIEDDYFNADWNGFLQVFFNERDRDFQVYVNEDILITDCAKELGEKEFNDVVSFIEFNNEIEKDYGFRVVHCYKLFGKDNPFKIENDGRYNISFVKDEIEIDKDIDISDCLRQGKFFGQLIENEMDFDELLEEFEREKKLDLEFD